ncbi:hypothetical protein QR680_007077 [Steinernema hermaphroditum]|uniref:Uncharacterized protein n=1 Tax=Steinernema hermaphroditum TaxID=289476 RepID=A0AA39HYR2_9BILA|nr:hypothetical protein QR680_007077 [Steinernema hermaphroditum]
MISASLSPNSPSSMKITRHLFIETPQQCKICVSRREFFILLLLLVLLFACSSLISIALYARRRQLTPHSSHYPNFLTNILKCDS